MPGFVRRAVRQYLGASSRTLAAGRAIGRAANFRDCCAALSTGCSLLKNLHKTDYGNFVRCNILILIRYRAITWPNFKLCRVRGLGLDWSNAPFPTRYRRPSGVDDARVGAVCAGIPGAQVSFETTWLRMGRAAFGLANRPCHTAPLPRTDGNPYQAASTTGSYRTSVKAPFSHAGCRSPLFH